MEKEFALYPEAFELKQLGFAEDSFRYYKNNFKLSRVGLFYKDDWMVKVAPELKSDFLCLAPTYSQCFRFFREKHGLFVQPNATSDSTGTWYYFSIPTKRNDICEGSFVYEEAELACLRKLIEIVKNK